MLGGDVDLPFPENLRDPMNADAAVVGFEDLLLAPGPSFSSSSSLNPGLRSDGVVGYGIEQFP